MSGALHTLLAKLTDHNQSEKTPTSPRQQSPSPNAFTTTEIEMAKALCSLPSNGREERLEEETKGQRLLANVKEEASKRTKSEEFDACKVVGEETAGDATRPIDRQISVHSSSEKIFLNANFESFTEFESAFDEWKCLYKHPFRVASSEKHHDSKFKYRYVVYHCSRYGEPRKRGQGRRPHQNYLPCGCLAKLRLNFHPQPGEGCLCVTTLHTEHNHEPMSECHSMWLKRRKSSPEEDAAGPERSGDGRDFESSTMSGGQCHQTKAHRMNALPVEEHSPNSTASSSTALFSPLSLHAPQPHHLLHNSPSSSGGQSSSDSGGSSSSGGEAVVAALLMRAMPTSPLSDAIGGGKTQRQTIGRPPSGMFMDTGELGTATISQPLSAEFKHPLLGTVPSQPPQFVHGASNQQQQQHSLLLSTLKAALMANGNKDGAQIGGLGQTYKKLIGELFRQQQQQRTSADQRQLDQQQQQWHIMPIIQVAMQLLNIPRQELLRLEQQQQQQQQQQQPALNRNTNHSQNANQNQSTLFALISQSLQRDQHANNAAGTSATALFSALRSMNVPPTPPMPASSSAGFFTTPQSPTSSSSASSLLHRPAAASPLIGLLQQAHLISALGQPYGAGGGTQRLSPPHAQQQQNVCGTTNFGNGTAAFIAQQLQFGGEKQRREQQQMADNTLNMGRAEIIKEADLLLQALVNQMIHSKDLVSYLARLRQFLADSAT
ncbi:hypothetical protein GPALN_008009 [Globodera pallida]|nr:hypothetical protein GPALN_008009 [Globodera pallida]